AAVAADCGLELADRRAFYDLFAATPKTVSLFSMGANQSAQGVAKGLAILNVHLATGRIGKPGACPFSITGQPNAMGGRETGGLANTLAAHMDFTEADCARVERFWGAPNLARKPGLKAVEMFEAVGDGRIKALWVMATNPAVSMPRAERVRDALASCPFVVVSDCMAQTDTAAFAHVKLPALAWGEKDGTVTNSERRISRQRAVLAAPGQARPDWKIIADVATAMGHAEAFGWRSNAQVFREWARMTAYENSSRTLDLGPLVGLSPDGYDSLAPVQWPVTEAGGTARLFTDGRFPTPDGRARMVPAPALGPAEATDGAFPLALNTGRVRDHWHTLTRTGLSAALSRHAPEPYVDIHPVDALAQGIAEGMLTRVRTAHGEAVAVARITDAQRAGGVFMPMHWSRAYAPKGMVNPLVSGRVDPVSGQPEFKHTPARIQAYRETWRGFFLSRMAVSPPDGLDLVWRRMTQDGCQLHEFAGRGDADQRDALRKALNRGMKGEVLLLEDAQGGRLREAFVQDDQLASVLFMTAEAGRLPPRDWLAALFAKAQLSDADRAALLIGFAPGVAVETGPLVCACRGVRRPRIEAAIEEGASTLDAVGAATGA
ncbi:MAG: molybdopterin-dependent oxidoreductase, partial [Phenylobacterium sp.]|nr:molybdopterin-dependent oxidoreductase [Phenylobacterium sp.]